MLRVDGIVTTDQAARLVGVNTATVRQWVARGWLEPLRRGAKPLRFHTSDVVNAANRNQRHDHHHHLDTLWETVLAADDNEVSR